MGGPGEMRKIELNDSYSPVHSRLLFIEKSTLTQDNFYPLFVKNQIIKVIYQKQSMQRKRKIHYTFYMKFIVLFLFPSQDHYLYV